MTRRRPSPLLAALFGLWLTFAMVEPVTLHPCPMHDGMAMPAGATPAAMTAAMTATMGPMAAMAAEHLAAAAPAPDHGAPVEHHACTCLGMGCCTGIAGLPAPAAVGHWGIRVVDVRREVLAPDVARPVAADHVIPFGNGPPAPRAA